MSAIADWFPALTSSAVLGVLGFIAGTYYKAMVERNIEHNLEVKLERIRTGIRKEEEAVRSQLKAKDDQISALRAGALAGMTSRQTSVDKRRLEASERLWASVIDLGPLKTLSKLTGSLKMDVLMDTAAKPGADGQKMKEFGNVIWQSYGLDKLVPNSAPDRERPFLSPLAWSLFAAYRQILSFPMSQFVIVRTGVGKNVLADSKDLLALAKSALPHHSSFIDRYGTGGLPFLVDELEEKLLATITAYLDGAVSDEKGVAQAASILKAVEKVSATPEASVPDVPGLRQNIPEPSSGS